jgi:NDP-sugar pyrophosphorylase family protein
MKAMIMAAGFGTRLRPLTDNLPKALVPVVNRPVLERNIEYLNKYGIKDIIINAHYHADQIQKFVSAFKVPEVNLTVSLEEEILGTGGGLSNCRGLLKDDTFIVINSDILTNINLDTILKNHRKSGDIVTLVLHDYPLFNQIDITDSKIKMIHKTTASGRLAFTGIHVLEPDIFDYLPDQGFADIISDCYNPLMESGKSINAFTAMDHYWYDIGTLESYKKANIDFLKLENMQFVVGKNALIDPSVTLKNRAVIGNNSVIEKGAFIDNSIIWNNVIIKADTQIRDSIVLSSTQVVQTSRYENKK